MADADLSKTAFLRQGALYEFIVMPFGLCKAPATFERMIDGSLRGLKWHTCLCYIDDVVFSPDFPAHLRHLHQVQTCLRNPGLLLNLIMYLFAAQ